MEAVMDDAYAAQRALKLDLAGSCDWAQRAMNDPAEVPYPSKLRFHAAQPALATRDKNAHFRAAVLQVLLKTP